MKTRFIVASALTLMIYGLSHAQDVGEPAPDFSFNVLGGGNFTLSEQEGKVVMIFCIGYTCHLCKLSAPNVEANLVQPYKDNDKYVAIALDIWDGSDEGVNTFIEETGITMPVLVKASTFATSYNTVQDRLFLIDAEGKLIYRNNASADAAVNQVKSLVDNELGLIPTSLEEEEASSAEIRVLPNPVSDVAGLSFDLAQSGVVSIDLLAADGRLVKQVFRGPLTEGQQEVTMDLNGLSPGMYYASLTHNHTSRSVRVIKY